MQNVKKEQKCSYKFTALSKARREKLNKITEGPRTVVSRKQKTDRLLRSKVRLPIP